MTKVLDPKSDLRRVEILLHGKVQGVAFRHFITKFFDLWNMLGTENEKITGAVGNLKNDKVAVVLEGREPVVERVLTVLYLGSPHAEVERVEEREWQNITEREFSDFSERN